MCDPVTRRGAALPLALLLVGCQWIVGIEDRELDPADSCLPDIAHVAMGSDHTCVAIAPTMWDVGAWPSGHTTRCWGRGADGRLGSGATVDLGDDEQPLEQPDIDAGDSSAGALALGAAHSCLMEASGLIRCWGQGESGQLGYGNTDDLGDDEAPSTAGFLALSRFGDSQFRRDTIAAGDEHTCALIAGGKISCWGRGDSGQLGKGSSEAVGDDEPADEQGFSLGLPASGTRPYLAAGRAHSCAIGVDGEFALTCWGEGSQGQLGYGNTESIGDDEAVTSAWVVDLGAEVLRVAAGSDHTCGLTLEGVLCWGSGASGQLGYGDIESVGDDETPASVGLVEVGDEVIQLVAGDNHTCALTLERTVRCWGDATYGQLGYGNSENIGDDESPASAGVVDVGGKVGYLAAGGDSTCAVLENGMLRCWGRNDYGQLGYGNSENIGDDETPATAGDVPAFALVAAEDHFCRDQGYDD